MLVACVWHARSIRFACHTLASPAGTGSGPGFLDPVWTASSPRVVLGPIVDRVGAFSPIQKSDLGESPHEIPGVARPVRGDFNILATHTFKTAFRAILGVPEKKTNQRPASGSPETALKLDHLGVPGQCSRNSGVVLHA